MTEAEREMMAWLIEAAERGAKFIRSQSPEDLRAWAARADDFRRNGLTSECLPAMNLESAAKIGREMLGVKEGQHDAA